MGRRAAARVFGTHKDTVKERERRFAARKAPLMLYAVRHEFISRPLKETRCTQLQGRDAILPARKAGRLS